MGTNQRVTDQNNVLVKGGIFQRIKKFFAAPIFADDEEKTRRAALLNSVLASTILSMIVMALALIPFLFARVLLDELAALILLAFSVAACWLLRRGRVTAASVLFVGGYWLVVTPLIIFSGGIHSVIISLYVVGTVIAGLLLSHRGTYIYTVACGIVTLGLVVMQWSGYSMPQAFPASPWTAWLVVLLALFLTAIVMHVAVRGLSDALASTRRRLVERQQSEAALRESEERFATLSSAAFEGIGITVDDIILDTNPQLASIFGYEPGELIGQNSMKLVAPESRARVESRGRQEIATPYEHKAIKKDGTLFPVEVRARTITYKGRQARVAIVRDISDQERAAEAIRKSEKHFRALIENSSDVTLLTDPHWNVTYVSPSYERITGHRVEDQVGRSVAEIVHPDDRELVIKLLAGTTKETDQPASPPIRVRFADGTWHRVEGMAHDMFADPDIEAMVIHFRDVTEQYQVGEALRLSEEKFRRLFETSRDFLYIVSLAGNIIEVNKAANTFSGYTLEELNKMNIRDLYCDPELRERIVAQIVENGFVENVAIQARRKDGTVVHALVTSTAIKNENGEVVGLQGSLKDISELKRAEQALAESEKHFRALIENSTDAITLIDSQGVVLYTSPTNWKITGYTAQQRLGFNILDIIHPDDKEGAIQRIGEAMKETAAVETRPFRALHGDGTWHWFEGVAQNLTAEPSVGAIVINFRDITARKLAEESIARQVQRLRALHTIEQAITSSTELHTVLDLLAKAVTDHLHIDAISILLYDESTRTLDFAAGRGFHTEALKYTNLDIGSGLAGEAAKEKKIVHVPELARLQGNPVLLKSIAREDFVAYFGVPLFARGHLCGVMEIFHRSEFTPDGEWMSFLETLGGQAALAIDNARLLDVTQLHLKETESLYHINQSLVGSIDPPQLMQEVVTLLKKNFGYHYVQIFIREPEHGNFVVRAGSGKVGKKLVSQGYSLAPGEGIVGYTAETGTAFFTNDVENVIAFQRNPLLPESGSELAVPIQVGKQFLGLLDIHQAPPATLSQRDLMLVRAVADQLAVALQKAQLYTDLQASLRQEKETRTQLIHTEKLSVAGRLLASVSHELNNPLQAIHNALYLLKEETGISLQGQQDLNIVLSEAERMSAMLDRLRITYQPVRAEEFQLLQVNDIIQDVHTLVATHLRHANISFESHLDPTVPLIPGLEDQLRQVVLNLFMNAVDAMPAGGTLSVSTVYLVDTCEIRIDIADSGPGIDPAIMPHIFEPFITNKEKGTGLGLTISYEAIFNHRGRITAENLPEGGAMFRVWLPATAGGRQ